VASAGTIPPDAGELIGSEALRSILGTLAEQFDYVLIDAPPMLVVGDAMTLSANADAMILVTRLGVVHRGMLRELARLLETCPAEKLGYVIAGAELVEHYGYGYSYAYSTAEAERSEQQHVS
jgi:Mrp family chromosome partitioning ATPase